MRKKGRYDIEAYCIRCAGDGRAVPASIFWQGRYYCAKHNPSPTQPANPTRERSAAERAKKTAAQKRWREKKKKEHAELVALRKSKPESEQDGMSRYIGFDEGDER